MPRTTGFNGETLDSDLIEEIRKWSGKSRTREIWPDFDKILQYDSGCVSIRIDRNRKVKEVWVSGS